MKSEWRVTTNYIGTEKVYQVYRLKDAEKEDTPKNRDIAVGVYKTRAEAKAEADEQNNRDAERFWKK